MFVRHLVHKPGDTAKVATMMPRRLRTMLTPRSTPEPAANMTSRPGEAVGRRLVFDQLSGLAAGPVALAHSGWRARHAAVDSTRPSTGGRP
jgi:hypothetical protein